MLVLDSVNLSYRGQPIIKDLNLTLQKGEIGVLLGESGCGKTTLLNSIAGFKSLESGRILLAGRVVNSNRYTLVPEKRGVGMVFQDYALFPHLTVAENIVFGLFSKPRAFVAKRLAELLALVGLERLDSRYPSALSGGQKQRVALARALAPKPSLLLLDEPFSGLDAQFRERLATLVREVLKAEGISALMVTHDQYEAFAMADQLGVLDQGRLLQWRQPYEIYHQPNSLFVADFVGEGVFLAVQYLGGAKCQSVLGVFSNCVGEVAGLSNGESALMLVRPDDVVFAKAGKHSGRALKKVFRGSTILYTISLSPDELLLALFPSHEDVQIGQPVRFDLNMHHVVVFKKPTGQDAVHCA